MVKHYFSAMKILAQRPTHIFAVVTVLLLIKALRERERESETDRQTDRQTETETDRQRHSESKG